MFSDIKTQTRLSKREFKQQLPELRDQLLDLQNTLREQKTPVVVLLAGVDGAGKHEVINALNEWMDPRWIVTRAYDQPSDEERARPQWWRYWRDMPPKGQIALFQSAWYSQPLLDHVARRSTDDEFAIQLEKIKSNEQTLTDGGAVVVKFWLHLNKKDQRKRFQKLESEPTTAWQVVDKDWANWARYDRFITSATQLIEQTDTSTARWHIIDGNDDYGRVVNVATVLRDIITKHIGDPPEQSEPLERIAAGQRFGTADMLTSISNADYKQQLKQLQARLATLHRAAHQQGISTVCVFEGWDAAGKGGAIRRLIHPMEARNYRVIPIAAPTDEEHAQHYLWRFWRHLPRDGKVSIFDRSWYGRALVERVEGFCSEADWQRSFNEICQFENTLTEHGSVVCKFWLHITPDEQLTRFNERAKIPYKAWKLTDEDWRNREKWDDYANAAEDIFANTHSHSAPWTIVPANDKRLARLTVLKTVCEQLEAAFSNK